MDITYLVLPETQLSFEDDKFFIVNPGIVDKAINIPNWNYDDFRAFSSLCSASNTLSKLYTILKNQPYIRQIKFRSILNFMFSNTETHCFSIS